VKACTYQAFFGTKSSCSFYKVMVRLFGNKIRNYFTKKLNQLSKIRYHTTQQKLQSFASTYVLQFVTAFYGAKEVAT